LQALTPAERSAHFRSCIVTDPSTLPPDGQERVEKMMQSMRDEILAEEAAARRAS